MLVKQQQKQEMPRGKLVPVKQQEQKQQEQPE
jgi:hypothetical protein